MKDALPPDMKKRKPSKVLHALSKDNMLEQISEEMETAEDEDDDDPFVTVAKKTGDIERDAGGNKDAADRDPETHNSSQDEELRAQKRDRAENEESRAFSEGVKRIKGDEDRVNGSSGKVGDSCSNNSKEVENRRAPDADKSTSETLPGEASSAELGRKRHRIEDEGLVEDPTDDDGLPSVKKHKIPGSLLFYILSWVEFTKG